MVLQNLYFASVKFRMAPDHKDTQIFLHVNNYKHDNSANFEIVYTKMNAFKIRNTENYAQKWTTE
jgi:hypothetical protein